MAVVGPLGVLVGAPGARFLGTKVPTTASAAALLCRRLGIRQLWWHSTGLEPCGLPAEIDPDSLPVADETGAGRRAVERLRGGGV